MKFRRLPGVTLGVYKVRSQNNVQTEIVTRNDPWTAELIESLRSSLPTVQKVDGRYSPNTAADLFDAQFISRCGCVLLGGYLQPKAGYHLEMTLPLMDQEIQGRWHSALETCSDLKVLAKNYVALDNELHLQARQDAVIHWDSKLCIMKFYYAEPKEFQQTLSTCAKRSDIISLVASIYLSSADFGIMVYDNGCDSSIYLVRRAPKLFEAIRQKCLTMRDYLLLGYIPPCQYHSNANEPQRRPYG